MAAPRSRPRRMWVGPVMLGMAAMLMVVGFGGGLVISILTNLGRSSPAPPSATQDAFFFIAAAGSYLGLAALMLLLFQSILWLVRRAGVAKSKPQGKG